MEVEKRVEKAVNVAKKFISSLKIKDKDIKQSLYLKALEDFCSCSGCETWRKMEKCIYLALAHEYLIYILRRQDIAYTEVSLNDYFMKNVTDNNMDLNNARNIYNKEKEKVINFLKKNGLSL